MEHAAAVARIRGMAMERARFAASTGLHDRLARATSRCIAVALSIASIATPGPMPLAAGIFRCVAGNAIVYQDRPCASEPAAASSTVPATASPPSPDRLKQLRLGMGPDEVVAVLGSPQHKMSSSRASAERVEHWTYSGAERSGRPFDATFVDGRLVEWSGRYK